MNASASRLATIKPIGGPANRRGESASASRSRSPANIDRARREFAVGNLYINRRITGSQVDAQPFGGFKLSGTGVKAGSPDYLLHFMDARCITENTLRSGFVPDEVRNEDHTEVS